MLPGCWWKRKKLLNIFTAALLRVTSYREKRNLIQTDPRHNDQVEQFILHAWTFFGTAACYNGNSEVQGSVKGGHRCRHAEWEWYCHHGGYCSVDGSCQNSNHCDVWRSSANSSVIAPLQAKLLEHLQSCEDDSILVAETKRVMANDLSTRYRGTQDALNIGN